MELARGGGQTVVGTRVAWIGRVLFASLCCSSLLATPLAALEVVAAYGEPFGVGRVTFPLPTSDDAWWLEANGYLISERQGRLFYPTVTHRRVLGLLKDLLGMENTAGPSTVTIYFLFRGREPLELTWHGAQTQTQVVVPQTAPRIWNRLQRAWWENYQANCRLLQLEGDYPPLVETYLSAMLQHRLGLDSQLRSARAISSRDSSVQESLLLVLNVEPLRVQAMQRTLHGETRGATADRPVPPEIAWRERPLPALAVEPAIEPIADQVPPEWFYVRFGSFSNYLWLKRLLERNGGSVSRMVSLRGHDALLSDKTQTQLGLKETKLAEILGGQVISDVALVGRDTYLREGGAVGVLFEARHDLLKSELEKQRKETLSTLSEYGATWQELTIAGHAVTWASTPDHRFRSFQVAVGNYHLVTNSRTMVERFLEIAGGAPSLADLPEFRWSRAKLPLDREAAVWAFLSSPFFRGLLSPQYQIELRRRLQAVTDLEIIQLAQWAARHEGLPDSQRSFEGLKRAGFLPPQFGQRPDASRPEWAGASWRDSLRGARGTFLPIPDVPLQGVTGDEELAYARSAEFHRTKWTEMDPLVVELRRQALEPAGLEQVDVRVEMLPFDREKYGMVTSLIGPPTHTKVQLPADDPLTVEVVVQGGRLRPQVGPHHLFFGLQDREVPIEFSSEPTARVWQILRSAPAYLGAWPELGLLDLLPLGAPLADSGPGLRPLPLGLWRYEDPTGIALVGTQPDVLEQTAEQLTIVEAPEPAQVRVHIADVTHKRIRSWFAALDFQRAYQTSRANTRLLQTLHQQLGVPHEQALEVAQQLLDVQLICALGGKYEFRRTPTGRTGWISTHWPAVRREQHEPNAFAAPSMAWFRGLEAQVVMTDETVSGALQVKIQQEPEGAGGLPFFDFFRRRPAATTPPAEPVPPTPTP